MMSHIFISYSTRNSDYAQKLASELIRQGFEVWIDNQKLRSGEDWWRSIVQAIKTCAAFIVIMTPESDASKWVQREVSLADKFEKQVFPFLLSGDIDTENWSLFIRTQYDDMRHGKLPSESFFSRLGLIAPRSFEGRNIVLAGKISPDSLALESLPEIENFVNDPPLLDIQDTYNVYDAIEEFEKAEAENNWNLANHWLEVIKELDNFPEYFLLPEYELDIQDRIMHFGVSEAYKLGTEEAKRGYNHIINRIHRGDDPNRIWKILKLFLKNYPNFDPDGLGEVYLIPPRELLAIFPQPFEWCEIPAAHIQMGNLLENNKNQEAYFIVERFYISKYPITVSQYQLFIDSNGYTNPNWWNFSSRALAWHKANSDPPRLTSEMSTDPVTSVNWYEAVAFCHWLSDQCGQTIGLPTEIQWEHAFKGSGRYIQIDWDTWDYEAGTANLQQSGWGVITPVEMHISGASTYGVVDMLGNVWEWCSTERGTEKSWLIGHKPRIIRGGSYKTTGDFQNWSVAEDRMPDLGFRIVATPYPIEDHKTLIKSNTGISPTINDIPF